MLRGLSRTSLAPRGAYSYRAAPLQQIVSPFSTHLVLLRPQESDDISTQPESLTNDKSGSSSQATNRKGPFDTFGSTNAKPKTKTSSQIPFANDFANDLRSMSSTNSSSTMKADGEADDWSALLATLPSYSSEGDFKLGNARSVQNNSNERYTMANDEPLDPALRFEAFWRARNRGGLKDGPAKPSDGRICEVKGDVNRAYVKLAQLLAQNKIKRELRLEERYEKPNQKRRRLRSERHRRRFAAAVREKVQLVMELQARGV